ncbi:MAG TPA: hypothetical protein VLU94_02680, partial [Candidatus Nitrosotalea sp.]|nr:hypothetical protein [Candidatus Nitrosotalea sp.]
AQFSGLLGLNNTGQFTGYFVDDLGFHGYLWDGGLSFLPFDFPGATLTVPAGINDSRQFVGFYETGDEIRHGFVAATVAEPGAGFLFGMGLLCLIGTAWRRGPKNVAASFPHHRFL